MSEEKELQKSGSEPSLSGPKLNVGFQWNNIRWAQIKFILWFLVAAGGVGTLTGGSIALGQKETVPEVSEHGSPLFDLVSEISVKQDAMYEKVEATGIKVDSIERKTKSVERLSKRNASTLAKQQETLDEYFPEVNEAN